MSKTFLLPLLAYFVISPGVDELFVSPDTVLGPRHRFLDWEMAPTYKEDMLPRVP